MGRLRTSAPCWCGSGQKFKRCHGARRALARPPVRLGNVGPRREVPAHIVRPDYLPSGDPPPRPGFQIQTHESLERLRVASQVAAEVLIVTGAAVAPGVTTDELDEIAHLAYIERGAYPSTLGYRGFPKSICTSVNGVICHGIPDDRPLQTGDIVNVDVTAYIEGMHGDTSATFAVGRLDEPTATLIETTRLATLRGIAAIAPGRPFRGIAEAIEPFVESRGFGIVREYGGHGIGAVFHAAPHVNHSISPGDDETFVEGMTLTVEPMLTSGGSSFTQAADGWTEHIDDGLASAQFEHTVVVTATGVEILTLDANGDSPVGTLATLEAATV
ncbi:MAG: type I methionyl aminopeptidase [Acidimicrobiia bacterium]|nr:type I methionyl aminopeptidase [Acidimicrobiia bacterium]